MNINWKQILKIIAEILRLIAEGFSEGAAINAVSKKHGIPKSDVKNIWKSRK